MDRGRRSRCAQNWRNPPDRGGRSAGVFGPTSRGLEDVSVLSQIVLQSQYDLSYRENYPSIHGFCIILKYSRTSPMVTACPPEGTSDHPETRKNAMPGKSVT